ncbi:DNA-directed RNA polymerase II, subunit RpB5 [Chrysochromulina ericina virus CeV-01B]|uniref:DNA-directed RNA polymerase II, subunit RpB5 n=1 Tax=Chrysochromulina ericina virus CeV-01B TaxID=3070830 RepID=A0A0N9R3T1_9VIRU|nr:DNA-directed RNA polymerase II, subunit RpB5 [Chrysochromulina ericina virus]ALH23180.1 DNA-directed RNA polymerase II, subunit RpB5 [Chrysochromulina ericina virus CeV-01B]|tara:strand:+ start:10976 stop:11605 length:630 start_codon:yes stop_codon:yes gene_type:complete
MSENRNIISVFKSRNNILDILKSRGYNIDNYTGFSINEISSLVSNNLLDILLTNDITNKKIYIKYFNLDKSIRPNNVHEIVDSLFNIEQVLSTEDELIIIIKDEPNETLRKLQTSIYTHDNIFINLIHIDRLKFNILNHNLVPKHRVLSNEEKELVKKQYNIENDSQFPTTSRFDPVSQVLGIRPTELFEIERPSKTAIKTKFYRICST